MKSLFSMLCAMLLVSDLAAQINLPYEVDFSSGIPSNWTQTPGSPLVWTSSTHGKEGPGSAMADYSSSSDRATSRIELPALHFTWLSDATLQFNVAFVRIAFMAPAITLWYDKGEGWTLLDSWGEWSLADLSDVNHQLGGGEDYVPPLDDENIIWHSVSVDLRPFAMEQNVRFAFQAEFPNGGWVLLDDVKFLPMVAGVEDIPSGAEIRLMPNPAASNLTVETNRSFERVEIIDLLGRTVLTTEAGSGRVHVDVSKLPSGAYWLQLIDSEGRTSGQKSFIKE